MRKIIAFFDVNMVGCEGIEAMEVDENATDREIDDCVSQAACEYAESWEEGETEEEVEDFWQGVGGHWEDYVPKKHDMLKPGGGSFQDDFDRMDKCGE